MSRTVKLVLSIKVPECPEYPIQAEEVAKSIELVVRRMSERWFGGQNLVQIVCAVERKKIELHPYPIPGLLSPIEFEKPK